MFSIDISQEAEKDLEGLDKQNREIILKKIWSIRENPIRFLERLAGFTLWKLQVGDYRAAMQVDTKSQKLLVIKIGHRKNIYTRLNRLIEKFIYGDTQE
ncbi:type II toxin-antitoxin system RelE/ParE family toxin [Candidatus Woesearchaeota archaeon]|nr:type II toxin-antitoxin system RelE/ParE family toxin [Candidatus Woesearchaeota archaeon]